MYKKMISITAVLGLCLTLVLMGCGNKNTSIKKTLEDYQQITSTPSTYFSSFKKVNAMTDLASLVLEADADPDDTTERHTAETTAKIYSKNTTSAAVIGEFEDEDEVLVLEKMTGTNWYKIVYNGRVAYVQANVLEVTSDSAGSYNNYIGYSDDAEDFDEAAAHSDDTYDDDDDTSETDDSDDEPGSGDSGDRDDDEPAETEPAETDPAETEPAETDPAETDPIETESENAD